MQHLPVREMVLYKHGVAFYTREGHINAQTVNLTFNKDEINDVLKSLMVFDRADGQVLGIQYQTPMDIQKRLDSNPIALAKLSTLTDLFTSLRGHQVMITHRPIEGSTQSVTGTVLGVDSHRDQYHVLILVEDKQVLLLPVAQLHSIDVIDKQSQRDIQIFLDTIMGDDPRLHVKVQLTEGEHDLVVQYIAPAPTWRVSYRIVADNDISDDNTRSEGHALLEGWGILDNRLEEDLEDIRLTLVAGQAISFNYELYASKIPERPTFNDDSRSAIAPVAYSSSPMLQDDDEFDDDYIFEENASFSQNQKRRRDNPSSVARGAALPRSQSPTMTPKISAKDQGEFYQYNLQTPISVKRGDSVLVPIVSEEVQYARELLYNADKFPGHPIAALRFKNTTSYTLEQGPVTVVEDGIYKGEAVMQFTKENQEIYVPFAAELGIKITEVKHASYETMEEKTSEGYEYKGYTVRKVVYSIENNTSKPQTVTIESPIWGDLINTREADFTTATVRRWRVDVSSEGTTKFACAERDLTRQYQISVLRRWYKKVMESILGIVSSRIDR